MDVDLDALQALCDAATPGPWTAERDAVYREPPAYGAWRQLARMCAHAENFTNEHRWEEWHNAAFIAAARTALPELIAEVRRLRALLGATYYVPERGVGTLCIQCGSPWTEHGFAGRCPGT